MMNPIGPNSYQINKAYRDQKQRRATREQQAQACNQNRKKGVAVVKVISQIVMSIR